LNYVYQIVENCPRKHRVACDAMVAALLAPIAGLYHASKSRQVSRLYAVDAEFATLRAHLRFLAGPKVRVITPHQQSTALALLAEPGRMLGAWIRKLSGAATRPRQPSLHESTSGKLDVGGQTG
jgi:hypothetical protein